MDTFTVVTPCLGHVAGAEVQYDAADVQPLLDAGKLVRKSSASKADADASLDATIDAMAESVIEKVVSRVNEKARAAGRLNVTVSEKAYAEAKEDKSFGDFLRCLGFAASPVFGDLQHTSRNKLTKHYGSRVNENFGREFLATVSKGAGGADQSGAVSKASVQVENVGALGGFSVPVEYGRELYRLAQDKAILLPRVKLYTMTSNQLMVPALDFSKGATGVSPYLAGMSAAWGSENAAFAQQNANLAQIEFKANLLGGYTQASRQLLADNVVALEQVLTDLFSGAIAFNCDLAIFSGDGINKPLGMTKATAAYGVTRTAAAAGSILTDLIAIDSYMLPEQEQDAIWLFSPSAKKKLYYTNDASGKVVFIPNASPTGAIANRPVMRIFGKDAFFTQLAASSATGTDQNLVLPAAYGFAAREDLEIGVSEHFAFTTNLLTWRFLMRGDGQPLVNSQVTLQNGDVVSPFVSLNT